MQLKNAAAALAFVLSIAASTGGGAQSVTPDVMAKQWVLLVDAQNYADSWTQAGAPFQARISQQDWQKAVGPVRVPLGMVTSRTVKDVKTMCTLPGMPDGHYAVVRFDAAFSNKASAVETLSLEVEQGQWRVIGYFVR